MWVNGDGKFLKCLKKENDMMVSLFWVDCSGSYVSADLMGTKADADAGRLLLYR
jgi:hypothetical protein